MFKVREFDRAD